MKLFLLFILGLIIVIGLMIMVGLYLKHGFIDTTDESENEDSHQITNLEE